MGWFADFQSVAAVILMFSVSAAPMLLIANLFHNLNSQHQFSFSDKLCVTFLGGKNVLWGLALAVEDISQKPKNCQKLLNLLSKRLFFPGSLVLVYQYL